jgi:hypothetical protein
MRQLLLMNTGWLVALLGLLASIPLGRWAQQREPEDPHHEMLSD